MYTNTYIYRNTQTVIFSQTALMPMTPACLYSRPDLLESVVAISVRPLAPSSHKFDPSLRPPVRIGVSPPQIWAQYTRCLQLRPTLSLRCRTATVISFDSQAGFVVAFVSVQLIARNGEPAIFGDNCNSFERLEARRHFVRCTSFNHWQTNKISNIALCVRRVSTLQKTEQPGWGVVEELELELELRRQLWPSRGIVCPSRPQTIFFLLKVEVGLKVAECISSCRAQASQGTAFEKCRRFEEKCSRGWTEGDSFAVDSDSLACPGIVVKALPLHLDLKPPARKCKKTNTAKFVLTLLVLLSALPPKQRIQRHNHWYTAFSKGFSFHLIPSTYQKAQTLPKAQRIRGLSSYCKFLHKSGSHFNFRISIKH